MEEKVDLVAQLVEHNTFNVGALGSSPSGITKDSEYFRVFLFKRIHQLIQRKRNVSSVQLHSSVDISDYFFMQ